MVLSEFDAGALRHKAVVPKLCFKLESLGIWNRTNKKRCLAPTPRLCHFTGLGWVLVVWIFKSSSGDSVGQPSLEITGNRGEISGKIAAYVKSSFGTSGVLTILQRKENDDFSKKKKKKKEKKERNEFFQWKSLLLWVPGCGPAPESVDNRIPAWRQVARGPHPYFKSLECLQSITFLTSEMFPALCCYPSEHYY